MPPRRRTHWPAWQRAALLDMMLEARPAAEIARRLERGTEACRMMLGRLLRGRIPCPPGSEAQLEEARRTFLAPPSPRGADPRSPRGATRGHAQTPALGADFERALGQLRCQYVALARQVDGLDRALRGVEDLLLVALAVDVLSGRITAAQAMGFLLPHEGHRLCTAAAALAAAGAAVAPQGSCGGTGVPPVAPKDTGETPVPPENTGETPVLPHRRDACATSLPPLVRTGPGGDFVRDHYKAHGTPPVGMDGTCHAAPEPEAHGSPPAGLDVTA